MKLAITVVSVIWRLAFAANLYISIKPEWTKCLDSNLTECSELLWKTNEHEYWTFVSAHVGNVDCLNDAVLKRAHDIGSQSARLALISSFSVITKSDCHPLYLYENSESCVEIETASIVKSRLAPIDHVFGSSPNFILQGSIDDPRVRLEVKRLIEQRKSFALRPVLLECSKKPSNLIRHGFGVSMEVRSTIADADVTVPPCLKHLAKTASNTPEYTSIGLKAINSIMSARDPFDALKHVCLNYPMHKATIAGSKVSQQLLQYLGKINQIYPHDHPVLIINGLEAQPEILDAYSLTELSSLLQKYQVSGYDLLSTWFKKSLPRFHIPLNSAITILNDLESDQRYEKWPKSLADIFRPSRSVVKHVARNLVTCILMVDISSTATANDLIMNVVDLVDQNIPIRFALLPFNLPNQQVRYYYGLLFNLGLPEALKFITRPAAVSVEEYAKEHPRLRSVAFLDECANHKDAVSAFENYKRLQVDFDLAGQKGHFAIVNGLAVQVYGKDGYEDSMEILKAYQSELRAIQLAVKDGDLTDMHDPYERIFKLNEDSSILGAHHLFAPFEFTGLVDHSKLTEGHQKLAKLYNKIMTHHLHNSKSKNEAFEKQQKLIDALKDQMRALFPVLEQAQPISRAFMAPITFGDESIAILKITVVMNPLTVFAQRLISLLQYFGDKHIHCKIYLMAPAQGAERDFNSFYTFPGVNSILPKANFTFALQPDCPAGWALTVSSANVDLDNVKMTDRVEVEYSLKSLTVEGSVMDKSTGGAAAGQRIALIDGNQLTRHKSIVMGNYGYYQLNTQPGIFTVKTGGEERLIVVDRMDSILLDRLKVDKVEFSVADEEKATDDTINIFSIASGFNYEQLLRIMMLSAVKHTKHKLVFWLIDSLVSPDLRSSLDILSKKYHFTVRFVHYKWPSWLNKQTSRMRSVWAYKILFLDVLFPLDLKRILFVDADQVIRADLYDLYSIDMQDHVYGFTAFCDSRKEAEGYRFWKTGYWRDFLQGRPYHISAMFLVDLQRLRATLTSDMLRGHYQILSRDAESLSNLDQDLPNHIQHRIPIFKLPKDWLWCESWCSDEDKSKAKIIDLCSNPARAESKLESAMRIIPEWKKLNEQVLRDISPPELSDREQEL